METEKTCEFIFSDRQVCANKVLDEKHYCLEHSKNIEYDMQLYSQVLEIYRQDIREYFIRSNIYLAADLTIMYAIYSRGVPKNNAELIILLGGISFGIVITIFWYYVSNGALYWLRKWRKEVMRLDEMISRFQSYAKLEEGVKRINLPSEITNLLPIIFIFFWILIAIFNILFFIKLL